MSGRQYGPGEGEEWAADFLAWLQKTATAPIEPERMAKIQAYVRQVVESDGYVGLYRETDQPSSLIFVYGTLMRGGGLHYYLKDADLVGPASTIPAYELRDLGGFPALVEGGATAVHGELYRVDEETVRRTLDLVEGEGRLYYRRPVPLASHPDLKVQAYVMPARSRDYAPLISSGDWRVCRAAKDAAFDVRLYLFREHRRGLTDAEEEELEAITQAERVTPQVVASLLHLMGEPGARPAVGFPRFVDFIRMKMRETTTP